MKVESASMLTYENGNCKQANLLKQRLQVCLRMKMETASRLSYERRNCKYS